MNPETVMLEADLKDLFIRYRRLETDHKHLGTKVDEYIQRTNSKLERMQEEIDSLKETPTW